jgi:hypothetical protein
MGGALAPRVHIAEDETALTALDVVVQLKDTLNTTLEVSPPEDAGLAWSCGGWLRVLCWHSCAAPVINTFRAAVASWFECSVEKGIRLEAVNLTVSLAVLAEGAI